MLNDLAVGDAVITTSGFYGVVIDITDDDVIVEFGNNKNCRIPMRKTAITEVEKPETAVVEEKTEKKKYFTRRKPENAGIQKTNDRVFFAPETSSAEHGEKGKIADVFFF